MKNRTDFFFFIDTTFHFLPQLPVIFPLLKKNLWKLGKTSGTIGKTSVTGAG